MTWTKEGMRHELAAKGIRTKEHKIVQKHISSEQFQNLLNKSTQNAILSGEYLSDEQIEQLKMDKYIVNQEITKINEIMKENGFILIDIDKDNNDRFACYVTYGILKGCGIYDLYYVPIDPKAVGMKNNEWLRIDGSYSRFRHDMLFEILPKGAHSYSSGNYSMRLLKHYGDNHINFEDSDVSTEKNINKLINEMRKGNIVDAEDCW